tara:strand:- start:54 stop:965 length:912 start_codon:yes stop_codon:yes gene_type:complete
VLEKSFLLVTDVEVWCQDAQMNSQPRNRMAMNAAVLLMASLVGCSGTADTSNSTLVKADNSRTDFFDRPVALAAAQASAIPNPLVVLLTSDPWLMVIGSDSPTFALYSDGTAIFRTKSGLKSTNLDEAQKVSLVRAIGNQDLAALAGHYEAANATDQPDNTLLVYSSNVPFYISVYGSMGEASVRSRLPTAIVSAYDKLRNFDNSNAQPWLPDKVEVMLWPYEYAPDESIIWPQHWPHLNDPSTRKRVDSYSIFIESAELPVLKAFLASRKEKGAVEIDGKKWAASIRLPFPHEALWMAPAME